MLKCILGLLTPEQGDIRIDGQSVIGISSSEREKVNAKIGMLFQNAALLDSLLVWENVALGLIQANVMAREQARSEGSREGTECVRTSRTRWQPCNSKKNIQQI